MTFTTFVVLTIITLLVTVLLTTLALVVLQERRELMLPTDASRPRASRPALPEMA